MYIDENITARCYSEYMQEISSLSVTAGEVKNDEENSLAKGCEKLKNNFYLVYPFYFASNFGDIEREYVYALTLCGNLYFSYLLLLDGLIDKHSGVPLLTLHLLHERALLKLSGLFPNSSPFWDSFKDFGRDYLSGIKMEKKLAAESNPGNFSFERFKAVTSAKCAIAKCATAGLKVLSAISKTDENLNLTQDYFHIGLQILDDIQDWHDDFISKRNSYLIDVILSDKEFYKLYRDSSEKENLLGKFVYLSETTNCLLNSAKLNFQKALDTCENLNVPYWKLLVADFIDKTDRLILDFEINKNILSKQYDARKSHYIWNKRHIEISAPNGLGSRNACINKALNYLMIEKENGYAEMLHVMRLPSSEFKTYQKESTLAAGDIFQRTILVETYLSLKKYFRGDKLEKIIEEDISAVLDLKYKEGKGGWNYLPGYPLLPPDSDDLAQVIRILVSAKLDKMNEILDDHINVAVKYNRNPDGSFKTWILDPEDAGKNGMRLKTAVENYWGDYRGRDIEVTSNLLLSLLLYDRLKYSDIITKGLETVISAQNEKGCWESIWYWGPYYGTYIAVRLLTEMRTGEDILKKTKDFLLSARGPDGGWGINGSDPLNTSLSVLILKDIEKNEMFVPAEVFDGALSYLTNGQESQGCWDKVNFIRMRLGEADRFYGSRTVTTAFVLRALGRLISPQ